MKPIISIRSTTPEPPYCWQNKEARRLIRNKLDGDTHQKIALAVYDALTEIASNETRSTFTASQPHIGDLAGGYEVRSIQRVLPLLRELGVIHYVTPTGKLRGPLTYSILSVATSSRIDTTEASPPIESHSRSNKETTTEVTTEKKGMQEIPPALDTQEFKSAWAEWLQHHKDMGLRPWLPKTVESKFKEMETWGASAAVEAIEFAIGNGYKGIENRRSGTKSIPTCDHRALKRAREYPEPHSETPDILAD
jgi:hypothetical protein